MKRKLRVAAALLSIILVLLAIHVNDNMSIARGDEAVGSLVGGVNAVLNPVAGTGKDVALAKADELNIELGKEPEVVEDTSDIVMANVYQSMNVREEPTTESERVGMLYKDCGGTILERADGWTKIKSGNVIGWCSNDFLLFDEEAEKLAANVGITYAIVDVDTLRVRASADYEADTICFVQMGELFEVVGSIDGEWICVDLEGSDGYVVKEFVDITFKIDAGETLEEIKIREAKEAEAKRHKKFSEYSTDEGTLRLLAALIQCEAGGESYEGQLAVGAVVMNRVRSGAYPSTIYGVIFASWQFTPAMCGKLDQVYESGKIRQSCIDAAKEALSGVSNVGDCTHFRRNDGREGIVIGNHVFY